MLFAGIAPSLGAPSCGFLDMPDFRPSHVGILVMAHYALGVTLLESGSWLTPPFGDGEKRATDEAWWSAVMRAC